MGWFDGVGKALGNIGKGIGDFVGDAWDLMTKPITDLSKPITVTGPDGERPWQPDGDNSWVADNGIVKWAGDVGETIKIYIGEPANNIVDWLNNFFGGIGNWLGGIGKWLEANWWLIAVIVALLLILKFRGGVGVGGGGGGYTDDRDTVQVNSHIHLPDISKLYKGKTKRVRK